MATTHSRDWRSWIGGLIEELVDATGMTQPTAEDQLAELLISTYGWEDDHVAGSVPPNEIIALAVTLMGAEALTVHAAIEEAEQCFSACATYAANWDKAAFEHGNEAAFTGAIPF